MRCRPLDHLRSIRFHSPSGSGSGLVLFSDFLALDTRADHWNCKLHVLVREGGPEISRILIIDTQLFKRIRFESKRFTIFKMKEKTSPKHFHIKITIGISLKY